MEEIAKIDIGKMRDFPDNPVNENQVIAAKINEIIEEINYLSKRAKREDDELDY